MTINTVATVTNVRKALRIKALQDAEVFVAADHRDLLEIANRLDKSHVAYPQRKRSRLNALTVAIECVNNGLVSANSRVGHAIEWFRTYEPDMFEMADYLASA